MNVIERGVRGIDSFQQRHRTVAFGFAVIKKFGDDRGGQLAALMTYYGFLALFPLLLLLVTVLGYVLGANASATESILRSALVDFPIIGDQLTQSVHPLRGSGVGLLVGAAGLLWGAMGVTEVAQHAMAQVWNVPGVVRPNFATRLLRGAGLFVLLGGSAIATSVLASLTTFGGLPVASKVIGGLASVALNIGLFVAAFRLATPRTVATNDLVRGAVLGAIAWSIVQALGGYLVGHQLRHASQVYGYFASVLGLISWVYLGSQITIYAAELNVVRARHLWPRSIVQPPLTSADERTLADIARQEERRPEQRVTVSFNVGSTPPAGEAPALPRQQSPGADAAGPGGRHSAVE